MSKYYDNPKYNAAFDRCIDVMANMMLKYGNQVLEKWEKEEKPSSCELDVSIKREKEKSASRLTVYMNQYQQLLERKIA